MFLLAVILYGVSTVYSVFLWRRGFRQDNRVVFLLLLAGGGFHTLAMLKRGFSFHHCPVYNLFEATLFVGWTIVAAYLVIGLWRRVRFLGVFASPVLFALGVFALMPALDGPHGPKPDFSGGWVSLHAAVVLLAYGAFGLAAVAAAMYLTQAHDLKFNRLRAVLALLPPLERLERIAIGLVRAGLVLLTLGLVVGGRIPPPEGVTFLQDVKVRWSLLVWLLYLGTVLAHWRWALVGRRFAGTVLGVFVFVVLTFWATNLRSVIHNPPAPEAQPRSRVSIQPRPRLARSDRDGGPMRSDLASRAPARH